MVTSKRRTGRSLRQVSFGQSWCPGLSFDGTRIFRPSIQVLAHETREQALMEGISAEPLDLVRSALWLDQCFFELGEPEELLLPNLELLEYVRARYPRTRLRVHPNPRQLERSRQSLELGYHEPIVHSTVAQLGEIGARELFTDARAFLEARPWRILRDDRVLRFGVGRRDYRLLMGGFTRDNEQGFWVFPESGPISPAHMLVSFGPGAAACVHHRDLNLVDRLQLGLPRQKYPMFLSAQGRVGRKWLEDMQWLLQRLPGFAHQPVPIEEGRRRLACTDESCSDWFGRTGGLLLEVFEDWPEL